MSVINHVISETTTTEIPTSVPTSTVPEGEYMSKEKTVIIIGERAQEASHTLWYSNQLLMI